MSILPGGRRSGLQEQGHGIRDLLLVRSDQLHRQALLEHQGEVLGSIRRLEGIHRQLPHVLGGGDVGVLQDAGVAAVGKVLVHAPRLALGAADGDAGIVEEVVAADEALVELGQAR